MSEKCLYCNAPLVQKEGKRERKFCNPSHCTLFHLAEKNKDKPKGNRGRPKGAKNKVKSVLSEKQIIEISENGTKDKPSYKEEPIYQVELGNSELLPFDFGTDTILFIEKYTKFPEKDMPKSTLAYDVWKKQKDKSDNEIRAAFKIHLQKLKS